ncbi:hypothetical protein [Mesorhizobium sp. M0118]|uniref:hypothetical protein n=1 Tax=Mesorhizobium sp. M0118 TaxID=2956884 RepID=UPI00333ADA16
MKNAIWAVLSLGESSAAVCDSDEVPRRARSKPQKILSHAGKRADVVSGGDENDFDESSWALFSPWALEFSVGLGVSDARFDGASV